MLSTGDSGYPQSAHSPGQGKWIDNIDVITLFRAGTDSSGSLQRWQWPAVVLMPEEYNLRVSGMSVAGLRSQLEKYWGRGGIPGAAVDDDYQDVWVPGWMPDGTHDPYTHIDISFSQTRLDPGTFSRWVNRECAQWLGYFIKENHTLGAVHAWFAAFLGVTRESLCWLSDSFMETAQVHDPKSEVYMEAIFNLKFRMSFDLCKENHDSFVDGLPSLPMNMEIITNKAGVRIIENGKTDMVPRKIWDICANTVIPTTWFAGPCCPLSENVRLDLGVRPVSHAWVAAEDLSYVLTAANQRMWSVPLPKGVSLEDVRGEMIRLGVRYAWLDVLCLRQKSPLLSGFFNRLRPRDPSDRATFLRLRRKHEQRRSEEWKVDLPTIGNIYSGGGTHGVHVGGGTVIFMSGLGRPLRAEGWASKRHWLRRAWTLQETPTLDLCLIAGLPGGADYQWDGGLIVGSFGLGTARYVIFYFSIVILRLWFIKMAKPLISWKAIDVGHLLYIIPYAWYNLIHGPTTDPLVVLISGILRVYKLHAAKLLSYTVG